MTCEKLPMFTIGKSKNKLQFFKVLNIYWKNAGNKKSAESDPDELRP